jgi:acetylornithine/succinyldiaminopimelate/putrescine aminotransferase
MREVCDRHGALLILDEVLSGMGRTGTIHAWEQESVVPDLQTVAKGLGAGYIPIGALLISKKVYDTLEKGSGAFVHSQTYQGHPVACAAAYEVQDIIKNDNLMANVQAMGVYLETLLKASLGSHKNVGDIRGRGLSWGVSLICFCSLGLHLHYSILPNLTNVPRSNLSRIKQPKSPSQWSKKSQQLSKRRESWSTASVYYLVVAVRMVRMVIQSRLRHLISSLRRMSNLSLKGQPKW